MRPALLTTALVVGLLGVPTQARAATPEQQGLARATAAASALAVSLEQQAAQDGGLRVALERLARERELAQAKLDARVRLVWTARQPDPLAGLTSRLAATGLRRIADAGASAGVRVDRRLVEDVASRSAAATALQARAARQRLALSGQVTAALAAQEQARQLLARAERRLAEQELAAARAETIEADRARLVAEAERLAATRAALDTASAVVTTALAPAQTRRGRAAQTSEAAIVALVEAASSGYPTGYAPTGQVLAGAASWYGPGFVGSPTATGAPYDPERLTCAHKTLPLGTVVRVSANGHSVSCLVNDRGPYVGDRILDMSRAGSRALAYDGVAQVVVEVLAPQTASPSR